MSTISLSLTVEQVNLVLAALGNAPYAQVASTIAEIQKQAAPQVQSAPAAENA